MDTANSFQFLSIFAHNFYYFSSKMSNFGPIQLDIIDCIVSQIINYEYPKFHAFIKKLAIDVISRWL